MRRNPGLEWGPWRDEVDARCAGPVIRGGHESLDQSAAAGDHLHPGQVADRRYVVEVRQRGRHGAQRPNRLTQHSDHTAAQHLHLGWEALSRYVGCRLQLPTGRGVVEQDAHDLGARNPVHRGVMHLRQHRHRAVLQPVDHIHLPQRARPVQVAGDQMSHLLGQLALIARRGKRDVADVVVDVDSAFVNPVRMVEAERHTSQSPPQRGQQVYPLGHQLANKRRIERPARRGDRVIHPQCAHVTLGAVVLGRQEQRVECRQLSHWLTDLLDLDDK